MQGTSQESQWQVAATGQEEAAPGGLHVTRRAKGPAQDHLCLLNLPYFSYIHYFRSLVFRNILLHIGLKSLQVKILL